MGFVAACVCIFLLLGESKGGYIEDISIIGAGIGGTYTGWRLRNKGLRIGIYEYSNRVGGRMYTRTLPDAPDLPVDFGAMRLRPANHPRMIKAGRELGLTFVRFVEEMGRIPERTRLYLRNTHLSIPDLGTPRTPYRLRPEERRNPSDLERSLSELFTNYNGSDPNTELFTAVTLRDGIPLYLQSYKEVIRKTGISNEAYNYIFDNNLFQSGFGDEQCIETFPKTRRGFEENTIPTGLPRVVSVPTGMGSYPTGFMRRFLSRNPRRHRYHPNSQLIRISRTKRGLYLLKFRRTRTINGRTIPTNKYFNVITRNVILALPKVPIQRIQMPNSNNPVFQSALNSVIDVQASKIFLVYDYPWWLQERFNFTFTHSDLPYRQSLHWGISRTSKAVFLMSYADFDDVAFWSPLQRRGNVISKRNDDTRVTDEVIRHAHSQISKVYKIDSRYLPTPVDGMMFVWDKYPFHGGWVSWKPGSRWYDIKNYLTRPFPQDNIFIVHGYWGAEHNGWGESSLEAADDVLTHFGLPSYLSNTIRNKTY
ncbi:achacin-like isoform X1 [Saccostrea echinata]|uniref:achacin-like isoform X1 n=1 Tax=Saccostrea echinata TaxID=191078 RepID=UPI002A7F7B31|nr:achacin-like isoform X1 [Saccostrea echinata]